MTLLLRRMGEAKDSKAQLSNCEPTRLNPNPMPLVESGVGAGDEAAAATQTARAAGVSVRGEMNQAKKCNTFSGGTSRAPTRTASMVTPSSLIF